MSIFNNGKKSKSTFRFSEPENTACFVCIHIINKSRPILHVTHEAEDGAWTFFCGYTGHVDADIKVISIKEATDLDPSINDLYEMPLGVGASRESTSSKWEPVSLG